LQQVDPRNPDNTLVVVFKTIPMKNDIKTLAEGRPIFDDVEVVTIRAPGSQNTTVQVATDLSTDQWLVNPDTGEQYQRSYAERFARQYQQFKARQQQTIQGTPLDYATFLTDARRAELRAMNVYTMEQLAAVDGQELKNLGPNGRDYKNRSIEYLADSKGKVHDMQLAADLDAEKARNAVLAEDNEALKTRLAQLANGDGQFAAMSDEQVRAYITTHTGHAPQGNLSRKMLLQMATAAVPSKAA
jgi:hypothetical protein